MFYMTAALETNGVHHLFQMPGGQKMGADSPYALTVRHLGKGKATVIDTTVATVSGFVVFDDPARGRSLVQARPECIHACAHSQSPHLCWYSHKYPASPLC